MNLLNQTTIPYRQLTVPCCRECNGDHLQPLETEIASAVARGADAVAKVQHHRLFLWLGKILYGLIYRELTLLADRASRKRTTITNREFLRRFEMHHYLLQGARFPMVFSGEHPASILIFKTQLPAEPAYQWDFRDNPLTFFISCRMGPVGLIGVLQDGGAQRQLAHLFHDYADVSLHPIQFAELCATVSYKASLLNRIPKFIVAGTDPIRVIQLPLQGFSTRPVFNDWRQDHYGRVLAHFVGAPFDTVFVPPDKVMTWLRNDDGSIKNFDFTSCPWLPQHGGA